jgi:predicted CXXCH cytochrome family protein
MKTRTPFFKSRSGLSLWAGVAVGLFGLLVTTGLALATPDAQQATPTPPTPVKECGECHLDIANHWSHSPHAHAFDDPVFQDWWTGRGQPGECLLCHTTGYQATTGEYVAEGVSCEGCHGQTDPNHPPAVVSVKADTEYCGSCHTTSLGEWRLTGHAAANVGCMDCHDPHSQGSLFEVADDMCLNCHKEDMGNYLEDLHIQKGIGCVDCHALVIPPETPPEDGIVPTGHQFTITTDTCVACHTDTLHAGFSLPGYENGAKAANGEETVATPEAGETADTQGAAETVLAPEQQIQALEAAVASRSLTALFQGGVVGLVLGGSTAWFVAHNARRGRAEQEQNNDEESG